MRVVELVAASKVISKLWASSAVTVALASCPPQCPQPRLEVDGEGLVVSVNGIEVADVGEMRFGGRAVHAPRNVAEIGIRIVLGKWILRNAKSGTVKSDIFVVQLDRGAGGKHVRSVVYLDASSRSRKSGLASVPTGEFS